MKSDSDQDHLTEELYSRIEAQRKTIEVLMDAVEGYAAEGKSSLSLLSENLNLERVVQQKTVRLQQQEQELRKALDDLQLSQTQLLQGKKLESVGRLAAGIAHEINTPIQFIGDNINFLKEAFVDVAHLLETINLQMAAVARGESFEQACHCVGEKMVELDWDYLAEEIPAAIDQSRDGVKRISSIVQAMKEFSHPSSKEMAASDLNRIIQTTITVASNEWKYWANMETELDPDLEQVMCLSDELGQVILNLLVNGAHALEEKMKATGNSDKGTITVSTRQDGRYAEIRIADTGCGIPAHIREKVFEPFFTTKPVGRGTGQGLAIAHDVVVKKHGGTLDFDSKEGQGTVFIIRLPLDRQPQEP